MASILDVAREANVAPSTVSLVANGHPLVAHDTRQRVESIIKRMEYEPRSARKKKAPGIEKKHVGVVYGRSMVLSGELVDYCRQWIGGIRESFGKRGADVSVSPGAAHIDQDLMFVRNLEIGDFGGLVLMGVQPEDGYRRQALKADLPLVMMNQWPHRAEFSSVHADAYAAGRLAAEHLLTLGHHRLATLFAHRPDRPAPLLKAGFADVLGERGLPPAIDLVEHPSVSFDDPTTYEPLARQLLDSQATACFCGDPSGKRLADIMTNRGIDVPGDVSILGWDDLGFTTAAGRRLSSIGYNKRAMGLLAGQMLQNLLTMNGEIANLTATVQVSLTRGATTGSCPKSNHG